MILSQEKRPPRTGEVQDTVPPSNHLLPPSHKVLQFNSKASTHHQHSRCNIKTMAWIHTCKANSSNSSRWHKIHPFHTLNTRNKHRCIHRIWATCRCTELMECRHNSTVCHSSRQMSTKTREFRGPPFQLSLSEKLFDLCSVPLGRSCLSLSPSSTRLAK